MRSAQQKRFISHHLSSQFTDPEQEACDEYKRFVRSWRSKPVFHIEYVAKFPTSKSLSAAPTPNQWQIAHPTLSRRNATQKAIRDRLCVQQKRSLGPRLSTVIKTINLDGWIMNCNGQTWTTRANNIKRNLPPGAEGPIQRRNELDDPLWQSILNGPNQPVDEAYEALIDEEVQSVEDDAVRKGAAKDKRPSPYYAQLMEEGKVPAPW